MKQITKKIGCLLIGLGALSVTTIATPLVVKQLISLNSVTLDKTDLSTLFPSGLSLGTHTKAPSSDESLRNKDLLTMMKTAVDSFNDTLNQEYYEIDHYNYSSTNKTGSFTIIPTDNNPIYYADEEITLSFIVNPNGKAVLSNFFGGSTTYNITLNSGSKLTSAYFPSRGTEVTPALLLQAIKTATYESQSININQLNCSVPEWDSTNDCYKAILSAKPTSNFYDTNSQNVTIQFNKQRLYVNASTFTNLINGAYYYIPDDPDHPGQQCFDGEVLWSQLADINTTATSGSAAYIFKDPSFTYSSTKVSWSNLTTLTPYFRLSGDQTYSTKTQTAPDSQTQNNADVDIRIADKLNLSDYVTGNTIATNKLLEFTDTDLPSVKDIEWAITNGGAGIPGTPTIPLDINFDAVLDVSAPIPTAGVNGSGTCTITAGDKSLLYEGVVTIYFTYTYPAP